MDENNNHPPIPEEELPQNPFSPEDTAEQPEQTGAAPEHAGQAQQSEQAEQVNYHVSAKPPRRPFFRDTWEIFRHMFTRHADRILTVAAGDSYPVWHANLVVILAAALVGALLSLGLNQAIPALLYYRIGWQVGLVILSLALTAANFFLLTLALHTAVRVSVGSERASWRGAANVVSCCLLVSAALTLAGSLIPLVGGALAALVTLVVQPVLLYTGFRKLTGEDGHLWPFIWSIVLYTAAVLLLAAIALVLFAAGTFWGMSFALYRMS